MEMLPHANGRQQPPEPGGWRRGGGTLPGAFGSPALSPSHLDFGLWLPELMSSHWWFCEAAPGGEGRCSRGSGLEA